MNPKEKILWLLLKDKSNSGYNFKRQFQHGNYVLDFFSEELNLAIELGDNNLQNVSEITYHYLREEYLSSNGIRLLKIPESFLQNEIGLLLNKILNQKEKK
jgi:very-short-patch-repair endonuclease